MSTNDNFYNPKAFENSDLNELMQNKLPRQNKLSINSLKLGNFRTLSTNIDKTPNDNKSHGIRFEQNNIKTLVFSPQKQKVEPELKDNYNSTKRKFKDEFNNVSIKKVVFKSEKHKELR